MATTRASSPSPSRSRPRRSIAVSRRTAGLQRRAREKAACSFVSTALLLSAHRLEHGTWEDTGGSVQGRSLTGAERGRHRPSLSRDGRAGEVHSLGERLFTLSIAWNVQP